MNKYHAGRKEKAAEGQKVTRRVGLVACAGFAVSGRVCGGLRQGREKIGSCQFGELIN